MAVTRTYGLSGSGMDVDSMVKSMMKAQQTRYDSLIQKKTQVEWKKADYNTMYTAINDFRNNTVFNYKLQNTLMPHTATSSDSSKVTVSANADAANFSHVLTIDQLATGVIESSSAAITATGRTKDTLANQFAGVSGTVSMTINGKSISVDSGQSIYQLVSNINNANAGVKANYDANMDRFYLTTTDTGSGAEIDFTGTTAADMDFVTNKLKLTTIGPISAGVVSTNNINLANPTDLNDTLANQFAGLSGTFNLKVTNGSSSQTLTIDTASSSLQDVIDQLNSAGVNAIAGYDTVSGKFSLQTTSGSLSLAGSDSAALSFLTNQLQVPNAAQGQDAKVVLDGVSLTQSRNNFSVSGVSYTLQAVGTANVTVASDVDKTVANVKAFVDSYNALLAQANNKADEAKYRDFLPLTTEQKTAMKDADITAWEAKAKSGLLRNDPILENLISTMRSDLSNPISGLSGKYNSASSIGITTGAYQEGGKLYLDESKLRKALQDDPDIVNKIFGSHTDGNTHAQDGIAVRLYDTLKASSGKIVTEAGVTASALYDTNSSLAKQINSYTEQMTAMSARMKIMEDRYYTQFNAMETALSKLSQQSSWLSNQTSSK